MKTAENELLIAGSLEARIWIISPESRIDTSHTVLFGQPGQTESKGIF